MLTSYDTVECDMWLESSDRHWADWKIFKKCKGVSELTRNFIQSLTRYERMSVETYWLIALLPWGEIYSNKNNEERNKNKQILEKDKKWCKWVGKRGEWKVQLTVICYLLEKKTFCLMLIILIIFCVFPPHHSHSPLFVSFLWIIFFTHQTSLEGMIFVRQQFKEFLSCKHGSEIKIENVWKNTKKQPARMERTSLKECRARVKNNEAKITFRFMRHIENFVSVSCWLILEQCQLNSLVHDCKATIIWAHQLITIIQILIILFKVLKFLTVQFSIFLLSFLGFLLSSKSISQLISNFSGNNLWNIF